MDFEIEAADGFPWDKVSAAKRYLYAVKPWWARFGERLKIVPVYQPPVGNQPYGATTSTDRQFRLYIDRGYALAKPVHILAGAIEHEFQHHTRNTFSRLRHLSDEDWAEFANIAFNLEINGGMDAEQRSLDLEQVRIMCQKSAVFSGREMDQWQISAPPGLADEGWIPRLIPLPDSLSAEEYFGILKKSKEEQEKREREEEQKRKEQEEKDKQEAEQEADETQEEESADDGSEAEQGEESQPESPDGDESEEDQEGGNEDGADSEPGADPESGDEKSDGDKAESDQKDHTEDGEDEDSEGDQENAGASTSDRKDDEDPDDDAEANDASNGDEDLSDGGESDGSEDSEPDDDAEGDADESAAKDTGSVGGNHSADKNGSKPSDSKGDNGNASIAEDQDASGQESDSETETSQEPGDSGEPSGEVDENGKPQDAPGDERVIPTAEIADAVDALKEKLDNRLWAKEMENPSDEFTANQWKPDDRDNEKPVDRTEISEAMQLLEQDVTEANLSTNFGLKPGTQIVNWVFRQQKVRGVDWQSRLMKLISSAYTSAKISGASDLSYSVRNPNQPEFGAILQGLHDYAPNIMVIQDVSGSMRTNKRQSVAMSAFTELCSKVLGAFNSKVTWVTVDTDIIDVGQASSWSKQLHRRFSYGFGGTKIGPVIETCMQGKLKWKNKSYPKPDLLIVVTDCAFDWPEKRPTKKSKLLVACVDTNMSNVNFFLPKWIERKREFVLMR